MRNIDEIINESRDAREVKRAICVKMALSGKGAVQISELLNVPAQYVSKWKGRYEEHGALGLLLGYRGSQSYLSTEQRQEVLNWIGLHETITVEAVRDYVEERYGVDDESKQSYYDLMQYGGMSYHKSEKRNPLRDEAQVLARREEIKKKWNATGKK